MKWQNSKLLPEYKRRCLVWTGKENYIVIMELVNDSEYGDCWSDAEGYVPVEADHYWMYVPEFNV